jgi:curved DNA-binding protein
MEFKDYYATLGVERSATQDEVQRAYRKLARKFHPDLNKAGDAEARFKEVGEAYKVLKDPERRAAYDAVGKGATPGQDFEPPPDWDSGFEFSGSDFGSADAMSGSDFFEALFGARSGRGGAGRAGARPRAGGAMRGEDHHARIVIDLADAYRGARRTLSLRMPVLDAQGHVVLQERQLEVSIPAGVREGQHLRLAGQGSPGIDGGPAGDLYLEVGFAGDTRFRVEGRDVYVDLPITPWEAALGATVGALTPDGPVELGIPAGSSSGRKLRLRGKGLPGSPPGDLYAVLGIVAPAPRNDQDRAAYAALARQFADFDPRRAQEAA